MSKGIVRNQLGFRFMLSTLYILFWLVRLYYMRRGSESDERISIARRDRLTIGILSLLNLVGAVAGLVHIFAPQRARWATLPTPTWSRWMGMGLGIVTLPLFAWTHHALGKNWSADLVIKEEHTLVTGGPYRWVRHPMYTSFFGSSLAFFLLSANWVIGLVGLATIALARARVDKEEALMIEEFGDEYQFYMQRTGRFLPRITPNRVQEGML